MANIPVITSPNGVWPQETIQVDDAVVAAVEGAVLRRPIGTLHEQRRTRSELDMAEKVTHTVPKITANPSNQTAAAGGSANFVVQFSADPAAEVRWYGTKGGVDTLYVVGAGVAITTNATQSTLALSSLVSGQNGTTVRAEIRNYKGAVVATATLTVT